MLVLGKCHPAVGLLAAAIPWLFLPAAFGFTGRFRWLSFLTVPLPFLAIVFFFEFFSHYKLFLMPTQRLGLSDLAGLAAPLVMVERKLSLVGFCHIPAAALIMGFSVLFKAKRFGIIAIFAAGALLAFCPSFLNTSPAIWLTIPVLCCSILIGLGMQGLAWAGFADRKWILVIGVIMAGLTVLSLVFFVYCDSIFAGLGAKYASLFLLATKMYLLGTIIVGIIFLTAHANLRVHWFRWTILSVGLAADIFLCARIIADKIF